MFPFYFSKNFLISLRHCSLLTKSFIDKTTDTMNKYLKKKIGNYEDTKIIFNYNITIEKLNEY